MWEFSIWNEATDEQTIIWGHSFLDACRRCHKDPSEWEVLGQEYAD